MRNGLLLAGLMASLAACGGGESPTTPPGSPAAPASGTQRVAFASNSITVESVDFRAPSVQSISFTLTNVPGAFWYRWTDPAGLVTQVTAGRTLEPEATTATASITLAEPARLGAGSYSSTLTLTICEDANCSRPIAGSPVQISISYRVTGAVTLQTGVGWNSDTPWGLLEYDATDTTSLTFDVAGGLRNYPITQPLYFRRTESTSGLVTAIQFIPPQQDSAPGSATFRYRVTLRPAASLGSGIFSDRITLRVCLDPACAQEIQGSPLDFTPTMIVYAAEGRHVARRDRIPEQGAESVAWSSRTQRLYLASTRNRVPGVNPGSLLELDPATLQTTRSIAQPADSLAYGRFATSMDGEALFAASRNVPHVYHYSLVGLVNDYTIDLGAADPGAGLAAMLLPLVGSSRSILLSMEGPAEVPAIVAYDGTTRRPTSVPRLRGGEYATPLARRADPTAFIAVRLGVDVPPTQHVDQLQLSATGVSRVSRANAFFEPVDERFRYSILQDGGRLFDARANVRDAVSGAILTRLPLPDGFIVRNFVIDATNNRLHALVARIGGGLYPFLASFRLDTLAPQAIARVAGPNGFEAAVYTDMVSMGSGGVALTDGAIIVALSGPFFTTYTGLPGT